MYVLVAEYSAVAEPCHTLSCSGHIHRTYGIYMYHMFCVTVGRSCLVFDFLFHVLADDPCYYDFLRLVDSDYCKTGIVCVSEMCVNLFVCEFNPCDATF